MPRTSRCRNWVVGGANCAGELLVCMLHIYEAGEGKTQGAAERGGRRTGNWKRESVSDGCDSLESQIQMCTSSSLY